MSSCLAALPVVGRDGAVVCPLDTARLARSSPSEESPAGVAGHGPVVKVTRSRGSADPATVLARGNGDGHGGVMTLFMIPAKVQKTSHWRLRDW